MGNIGFFILGLVIGLIMGVGLMALMCANGRCDDDDFYNGGVA